MKLLRKTFFYSLCMLLLAACGSSSGELATGIIPAPEHVTWGEGAFRMPASLTWTTDLTGQDKTDLAAWMERAGDFFPAAFAPAAGGDASLELLLADGGAPESYVLDVTRSKITITAPDAAGLFYGLQSLAQLAEHHGRRIPAVQIGRAHV